MEIREFDPAWADQSELEECHRLHVVIGPEYTGEPAPPYDRFVAGLRTEQPGLGSATRWAAYADGRMVGFATARFPDQENGDLAMVHVTVHPDHRRRGLGTEMLRAVLPALHGRSAVEAWTVPQGGSGDAWATHLGFRSVFVTLLQRLAVHDVAPTTWDVPEPGGYHTVAWTDAAPDRYVASFADARTAIQDSPQGDYGMRTPEWTVDRVREVERVRAEQGVGQLVVAAVRDRDDRVAGFTELELRTRGDLAVQADTAVLAADRGHGLGRCVKARLARWLRADHPGVRTVLTSTASSNAHMIRVNHQIGFTDVRTTLVLNTPLADLAARLGTP